MGFRVVRNQQQILKHFKKNVFEGGQGKAGGSQEVGPILPASAGDPVEPNVDPAYSASCLYRRFYHFRRPPFNNTPDPKFFFLSRKHQEALSRLLYAAQARKGFVLLTGEIGSGKTTLCRALMSRVRLATDVALVTNSSITSKELIRSIAEELGLSTHRKSKGALLNDLNRFLIERLSLDRNVLVILDEAQNLKDSVLEEVRMLSNLETAQEKLLQIFLVGQPELRSKIGVPELKQLRQRIALRYHVEPLDEGEMRDYIAHRIAVAESQRPPHFTALAFEEIYHYAEGIPRVINTVCDSALVVGFTRESFEIGADVIREVIADLEGIEAAPVSDEEMRLERSSGLLRGEV